MKGARRVSHGPSLSHPRAKGKARVLALATSLALLAAAAPLRADDAKTAATLFDQGRKLMEDPAKLAEACRVLAESYALAERGDTLLNLAECHRRQGKTATAWAEFDKAYELGAKVNFTRAMEIAKKLRDELAVKLSTLTVTVPPEAAALAGLTVEVNGKPWPRERWGTAVYVDPGPAEITVAARGYKPFVARVEVGPNKDAKRVTVALERDPSQAPAPTPPPKSTPAKPPPPSPPPAAAPPRPIWPWIVGGAGLAAAGVAVAFAVNQQAAGAELDDRCGPDRKACPPGYDFGPARSQELTSFGLFVGLGAAGIVAVGAAGVGLGLAYREPSPQTTSLRIGPGSVTLQGGF
jgi:hypothetical protein